MSRVDAVRYELSSAVRLLGEEGRTAKEQNNLAARETGLPVGLIERLRWSKIKNPAAYIADIIREAVERKQAKINKRARHEIAILTARLQALETRLEDGERIPIIADRLAHVDPEFFGAEAIPALQSLRGNGAMARPRPASETEGGER